MGCDIHAMIEKKHKSGYGWINKGDPEIPRNYELFAVLANVRNYHEIPFIAEPKGAPEDASNEFEAWLERWDEDAHSTSWLTLKEIKTFNLDQSYNDKNLVLSRNSKGQITSTCAWSSGETLGPVGEHKIFEIFGRKSWDNLVAQMEAVCDGDEENVRLVFFFDN